MTNKLFKTLALVLLITLFLTGCEIADKGIVSVKDMVITEKAPEKAVAEGKKEEVRQLVQKARSAEKETDIILKTEREENKIVVKVILKNINKKPITSVQSWLSFDIKKIQGKEINTENSVFSLQAPYDNTFDNEIGLVMIGRSNPEPVTDEETEIAEVIFEQIEEGSTTIDIYDYRDDLSGHASVNTIADGTPYNIMRPPKSPGTIIE